MDSEPREYFLRELVIMAGSYLQQFIYKHAKYITTIRDNTFSILGVRNILNKRVGRGETLMKSLLEHMTNLWCSEYMMFDTL